ncbi:macrophage migration inhibitory factor homolog isoform X3 [Carya illinoinensis]|uniref:macrophage migration inhibitory factor homolog isoform X3 n=1 Tax=Carya illinoinensis TaxID=32201 RepID=UPI001C7259C7|nr:macrophage migration inhibitory factor homolog isoform X3 [Carya illinoinensis]
MPRPCFFCFCTSYLVVPYSRTFDKICWLELYVMILLNGGVPITFAGTEEPAAYGELISIGGLGPSVNGKLSSTIAEILQTKLSIDSSRFYIKFYDVQLALYLYCCLHGRICFHRA